MRTTCDSLGEEFGASNIACLPCDVTDDDRLVRTSIHLFVLRLSLQESVFKKTNEQFGSLDIVVNNAGVGDESKWKTLIKVNLVRKDALPTIQCNLLL